MALKCSLNVSVRQLECVGCCVYMTSLNFACWETGLFVSLPGATTKCTSTLCLSYQALTYVLFHSVITVDII